MALDTEKQSEFVPAFDTSVLVAFSSLKEMELLKTLFCRAVIPGAVFDELVTNGGGWIQAADARREALAGDWLETLDLAKAGIPLLGGWTLDDGEREVISLALAHGMIPILDERPARRAAEKLGLRPVGTLGLLAIAKSRGILPQIGPVVARMLSEGLRFGDKMLLDFLTQHGERWPP